MHNQVIHRLKNSSLARDSFWALFGNAAGKGLALVAGIAIARFLGSADYGEYGLIKGTLLSIAVFSSFGLGYTATKFIAECHSTDMGRVRAIHRVNLIITLCASAFIAILVSVFAQPIALWLKDASLEGILRWAAIAVVFNAIITTQTGELAGFRAYKTVARNNIISGALTFVLVVPAAYFGGLLWAVIALVVTLLLNCLINAWSIRSLLKSETKSPRRNPSKKLIREVLTFSLPIALQESTYSIASWIGMALLIRLAGYSVLGVYSASNQWMAVMLFVPGALRNVALSHLSENSKDTSTAKKISNRLMLVNFVSTFIPFLVIVILSKWIATLYGPTFSKMPLVLNVCIFTAVVSSVANVLAQDMIAHSQNWFLFFARFAKDALSIVLAYFAIKYLSYYPATLYAISVLVMHLIFFFVLLAKRHQLYGSSTHREPKAAVEFAENLYSDTEGN